MVTEVLHETQRPPDFAEFAQLLENPEYHPPEYVFDPSQPGGFSVPGETTAGTDELPPNTVRTLLRLDYITGDKDSDTNTLHCKFDQDGNSVSVSNSPSVATFEARLGRRMLAVDIQIDPDTDHGTITAVHGVEPIYRGEPLDPERTPASLVIEGAVVETIPAVDLTAAFTKATGKAKSLISNMPMMCVQIDPTDPDSSVWVPREHMKDLSNRDAPSNPLPGDTVQVRIAPKMYYPEGLGRMVVPCHFANNRHSRVKTSYIMRGGGLRELELYDRLDETAAVVAEINIADTPGAVARLANRYFDSRYRVEKQLRREGLWEVGYLDATQAEVAAVQAAVAAKDLPPKDEPAYMRAAIKGGSTQYGHGDHPVAGLIGIASVLEEKGVLRPNESLLDMTVGDVARLTGRYADKIIMQLQGWTKPTPPEHRLGTLFDALDPTTREATIAEIIEYLRDIPQYQLFGQETGYIVTDLYDAADHDQALQLIQFVGNAARTSDDFSNMLKLTGNRRSDALLLTFIDRAEGVIRFQSPVARERLGKSDEHYQEMVRAAQAVLKLVRLGGDDGMQRLDKNRQRIIRELEALGL
jgi:hypothetical protein